jgi:sulfate adenylyltransferase subunit 1
MKGLLKFITCGSVDDGKSTLIGHILYDAKLIYADQEKALELDSKVGSRSGDIDYSLLLDGLMAEREQGITIDVAYRYFTTDNRSFIVADTPGHEEYTRNMAVGASFADLAVILIDASQGVLVQTRRHARICKLMGIRHFVFAVNKMDLVKYSKSRFDEIVKQIEELKNELLLDDIYIIPLSATEGDNVTVKSENIPWYNGVPLLQYLETVDVDSSEEEEGFYLPVQRVCRPDHTFRGFQGQIESGSISVGDEIVTLPSNEKAHVKQILMTDRDVKTAFKGQPVTITLDKEVDVSRGCVITKDTNLASYQELTASILWMDDEQLTAGKDYLVKLGTKTISGIVSEIKYAVDVNTGEHISADSLTKNGIAVCTILLAEPIAVDLFSKHKTLGELILIDRVSNMTSACGVVDSVEEKADDAKKASFVLGSLEARGDIFEEFFYDTSSLNVLKYQSVKETYTKGDTIPVEGESYKYPDSFDIIVLRDSVAVKVRDRKITDIVLTSEYSYGGVPVVNGRGFEVLADSNEKFSSFFPSIQILKASTMRISLQSGLSSIPTEKLQFKTDNRFIHFNSFAEGIVIWQCPL